MANDVVIRNATVVDGSGAVVSQGFIDGHTHGDAQRAAPAVPE